MEIREKKSLKEISLSEWKDIEQGEISIRVKNTVAVDDIVQTMQELKCFTNFDVNNILLRNLVKYHKNQDEETYNPVFFGSHSSIEWDL